MGKCYPKLPRKWRGKKKKERKEEAGILDQKKKKRKKRRNNPKEKYTLKSKMEDFNNKFFCLFSGLLFFVFALNKKDF